MKQITKINRFQFIYYTQSIKKLNTNIFLIKSLVQQDKKWFVIKQVNLLQVYVIKNKNKNEFFSIIVLW